MSCFLSQPMQRGAVTSVLKLVIYNIIFKVCTDKSKAIQHVPQSKLRLRVGFFFFF